MEYNGYINKEDLFRMVEETFPFSDRPEDSELFSVGEDDILRRIITRNIAGFTNRDIPYEGLIHIYDESSSLSDKAMTWMLPSMLRFILKGQDKSDNLSSALVSYLENMNEVPGSALNFTWLNKKQIAVLQAVMEYISESTDEFVAESISKLEAINITKVST